MTDAPSTPTAVVASYLASFAAGDPDAIAAHVADDFVNTHTAALGSSCRGRAAYRDRLPGFLASMPGIDYQLESTVTEGSHVAAFYTLTGTWQGGAAFSVRGVQHLVVEHGLITHRTDYWDSASFLTQVDPGAADALRAFGIG